MRRILLAILILWTLPIFGQTTKNGLVTTGLSTVKPPTCSIGDQFNATDTGQIYTCTAANTWTLATAGAQGPPGPAGPPYVSLWSSITTYASGAIASYSGNVYVSLMNSNLNNEPDTSPSYWQLSGGSVCGGLWSSTVTYTLGCTVTYNGSIYVSLDSNTDSIPSVGSGDWLLKGTQALVSVTDYGARSTNIFTAPGATVNVSTGTPHTVTALSTMGDFQGIGDGIAIFGAGAAPTISTPSAPTVAVSEAKDLVGTGYVVAASGLGSTTYTIKIAAYDAMDGGTAASTATTLTNGPASLGSQTTTLTSCARSGFVITCTAASPENIKAGSLINVENTLSNTSTGDFDGWYIVGTVADSTHFTYTGGLTTDATTANAATATSSSGGTVTIKVGLHISWAHDANAPKHCAWITAGPGISAATYIGCSRPNGSEDTEDWLEYWGPIESGHLVRPLWVPATPPSVATSETLATTITSAISGGSFTIAGTVLTSQTGARASFDNSVALAAAATAAVDADATLYIPPGPTSSYDFIIMAPTVIVGEVPILQAGGIDAEDTITVQNRVNWHSITPGGQQFALANGCGTPVLVGAAYPGVIFQGGNDKLDGFCAWNIGNFDNPTQSGQNNGALLVMADELADTSWLNAAFITADGNSNPNDYTGIGLLYRCAADACIDTTFNTLSLLGGPSQTEDLTWTPELLGLYGAENFSITNVNANVRGIKWENAGQNLDATIDIYHCQSCEMPMFTFSDPGGNISGDLRLSNFENDTEHQPDVTALSEYLSPVPATNMDIPGTNGQGGRTSSFSGIFTLIAAHGGTPPYNIGQNTNVCFDNGPCTSSQGSGSLFAFLPTCNSTNIYMERWISDSPSAIWGATVSTGSGSNKVKLFCNGSVWTVEGASGGASLIARGSTAMRTSNITTGTCDTVVTVSAPGTTTSSVVNVDQNAQISGIVGFQPLTTGALRLDRWPTANNVNFQYCNLTGNDITPGALTVNWTVQ